jgi:ribonuclease P protein component
LKGKKNIQAVYAERDTSYGKRLVFYRKKREDTAGQDTMPVSRFCFSVPKVCGSAVRRNRIKRILREIIRTHKAGIEPGWDFVIKIRCRHLDPKTKITRESFLGDFQTYFKWT